MEDRRNSSSQMKDAGETAEDPLHQLSVKQLKELLDANQIDHVGCVEKSELIALAQKHNLQDKAADVALHRNHLGEEKSPYLLQHKDNPVNWFPYGPLAFETAKKEDKPLLISIGYATCHWCHVMEHQSFEDESVAKVLNENFIAIKVDREEMPDVDTIYMSAAQSLGISGGWPLNVFVTPDLKPFFAGTYFPKPSFLNVLARLNAGWRYEREKVLEAGELLYENLNASANHLFGKGDVPLDESLLQKCYNRSKARYDSHYGGFTSAPKFPPSMQLQVLLRVYRRTKDPKALEMVEGTLKGMAKGGLYDHLGGGFARYSTDDEWLIPHFEKMLYDNALLLGIYLEAYQVTGNPLYASIARETADYVISVMQSKEEGGYYSAEDADSEGVEGKFYVWTKKEIFSLLPLEEAEAFCRAYGVTDKGNFEHGNTHLSLLQQDELDWKIKEDPVVQSASKKLFEIREQRVHPLKDDKQLTHWNGLMIKSMALAARVLGDTKYLESAQKAASFIRDKMYNPTSGTLLRRYRDGEAKYEGTLDDYVFAVYGLIQLYQTDFDPQWLQLAVQLQDTQDKLFWDNEKGGYYFTPASSTVSVIVRTKEYFDGATPSGNSASILNLLQLENLTYDESKGYKDRAEKIFKSIGKILAEHPEGFTSALIALDYYTDAAKQLALVLPEGAKPTDASDFHSVLAKVFAPNLVVACGETASASSVVGLLKLKTPMDGKPTAYLCEGEICTAPTTNPDELRDKLVSSGRTYSLGLE